MSLTTERQIVKEIAAMIQGSGLSPLKKIHPHINLANKRFNQIWESWYRGDVPPPLEVDLVLVFEDTSSKIDQMLVGAVEVKYFQGFPKVKRNFFEGLHQALALALFGFDGLGLWHLFAENTPPERVHGYAEAVQELINGLQLPFFYVAAKLLNLSKFEAFAPSKTTGEVAYFVEWMYNAWREEKWRNPLLTSEGVKRRRSTLKAMLQVPV